MKEQQNLQASMGNLNTLNTDFNSLLNMSDAVETNDTNRRY